MNHARIVRFLGIACVALFGFASCGASKSERKPDAPSGAPHEVPQAAATPVAPASGSPAAGAIDNNTMWVQKPDGSKSCQPESGTSLDKDAQSLASKGVKVLEKKKGSDGKMHIQSCGAATGKTNAFRIPKKDEAKAKAAGFAPVKSP